MLKYIGLFVCLLIASADARFPHGSAGLHGWNVFKIGAGGQVMGIDYPTSPSPFLIATVIGQVSNAGFDFRR
jgi:hypothetical protein